MHGFCFAFRGTPQQSYFQSSCIDRSVRRMQAFNANSFVFHAGSASLPFASAIVHCPNSKIILTLVRLRCRIVAFMQPFSEALIHFPCRWSPSPSTVIVWRPFCAGAQIPSPRPKASVHEPSTAHEQTLTFMRTWEKL